MIASTFWPGEWAGAAVGVDRDHLEKAFQNRNSLLASEVAGCPLHADREGRAPQADDARRQMQDLADANRRLERDPAAGGHDHIAAGLFGGRQDRGAAHEVQGFAGEKGPIVVGLGGEDRRREAPGAGPAADQRGVHAGLPSSGIFATYAALKTWEGLNLRGLVKVTLQTCEVCE